MIADRLQKVKKSLIREIFDLAPPNSINLGLGELQFKQNKAVKDFINLKLNSDQIRYTTNAGNLESRKILASAYRNDFRPEDFIITNGVAEGIFATLFSLINNDDEVIVMNPGYVAYPAIIKSLSGNVINWNSNDRFVFETNELNNIITNKTKAVIICNPSNPLGTFFSKEKAEEVVKICKKNNIILISDEIYGKLSYLNDFYSFSNFTYENIIVLNGLSKSHNLSGWRIGWISSKNPIFIQKVTVAHQYIATCAPYLSQKLIDFSFSIIGRQINETYRKKLQRNIKFVKTFFKDLNINFIDPQAGPYINVFLDGDDVDIAKKFAMNGIVTTPASAFGKMEGWIRINYSLEIEELIFALEQWKAIYESI